MDASLLQDFITESTEHLEEMENYLLQFETEAGQRDSLHDIFRCVHTIKGAAEFVGLEKIADFSHRLENLLDLLRRDENNPAAEVVDLLMDARDCMVGLVCELEGNGAEPPEVEGLLQRIEYWTSQAAGNGPVERNEPERSAAAGEPDTAMLGEDDLPPELAPDDRQSASSIDEPVFPNEDGNCLHAAATPGCPNSALLEIETIEDEENDRELFGIFTEQLKEKLARMESCARKMETADDPGDHRDQILEDIAALKSSTNYMGYSRLKRFLEECITWIAGASEQGRRISSEEVFGWIDAIAGCFPGLQLRKVSPPSVPQAAASRKAPAKTPAAKTEPPTPDPPATDTASGPEADRQLEDRLLDAFDLFDLPGPAGRSTGKADARVEEPPPEAVGAEADSVPALNVDDPSAASVLEPDGEDNLRLPDAPAQEAAPASAEEPSGEAHEDEPDARPAEAPEASGSPPGIAGRKNMRVDAEKIDSLMNQVGELVVNRSYFSQLVHEMRELQQQFKETAALESREMKQIKGLATKMSEATSALGRVVNDLQDGVMKIRMLPIAQLFNRYPRLVRDLVHDTGKKVRLEIKGESTELDKMIIEQMSDPLIHIIRNAVDHGFETVEQRLQQGKPAEGRLQLEAYHESNHVVIEIVDDGRGIDPEKIYTAALQREFLSKDDLDRMTPKELTALILRPGFSTAAQITHTSGRGVGMDVVKKNIEKLNGTIEIDSKPGIETRLRIKIPLTLAIISALLVRVGPKPFAIPLTAVEETLRIELSRISTVEGFEVIQLRRRTLPLLRLSEMFDIVSATPDAGRGYVVIVSTGMHRIGLLVDTLIGQEEVVIKPLADYIQEDSAFSGATILGDGKVSLILDGEGLVSLAIRKHVMKRSSPLPLQFTDGPMPTPPQAPAPLPEPAAP